MPNSASAVEGSNAALTSAIGRPRTVLDVGCKDGGNASAAVAAGASVVGVEGDASRAEKARRVLSEVIEADPGDFEKVSRGLGARKFDLVIVDVLSTSRDSSTLLRHYVEHLDPEGQLVVAARNGTVTEATKTLKEMGLEVLRVAGRGVVVARRPLERRPLSLTVGMLTMNEEESIEKMMLEIKRVAPDAQILCVDSSTKDQTHVIAERMGARVIRQLPPRGHGPAMEVLMYESAKQSDALIYLDCDFTYPPEVIPRIREILESGVDVVNAARTRTRPDAMPLPNYLANKSFALLAQATAGPKVADLHSGMRGYRASLIRAFSFDGEGDAIPIDTLLWPAKCGYRVVEVPIHYQERVGVSKLRKVAGTYWTFVRLAKTLRVGQRGAGHYEVWDKLDE